MKKRIAIISSSVRDGRLSHRVALFYKNYLSKRNDTEVDLIDLLEYGFPLFSERLPYMKNPPAAALDYARRIVESDGVIVVSPVYNASYPASLKNAVDLLVGEWAAKPIMVASVSSGTTPGISTASLVQNLFIRMHARVASPVCTITSASTSFSPDGMPANPEMTERYVRPAIDELMWLVEKSRIDKE